jgi:hypothetical protein
MAISDTGAAKFGIPMVIALTGATLIFTKNITPQLMTMQSSENNT